MDTKAIRGAVCLGAVILGAMFSACGETTAEADCSGTNGNAAVAACHPDDPAIQAACPDNSGGESFASPTDECLDAVRSSDA